MKSASSVSPRPKFPLQIKLYSDIGHNPSSQPGEYVSGRSTTTSGCTKATVTPKANDTPQILPECSVIGRVIFPVPETPKEGSQSGPLKLARKSTPQSDPQAQAQAQDKEKPLNTVVEEMRHDGCVNVTKDMVKAISQKLVQLREEKRDKLGRRKELATKAEQNEEVLKTLRATESKLRLELEKQTTAIQHQQRHIATQDEAHSQLVHRLATTTQDAIAVTAALWQEIQEKKAVIEHEQELLANEKEKHKADSKAMLTSRAQLQIVVGERKRDLTGLEHQVAAARAKEQIRACDIRSVRRIVDAALKAVPNTELFRKSA